MSPQTTPTATAAPTPSRKLPATRAKETVDALTAAVSALDARLAEHVTALEHGNGDELDRAATRALSSALGVLRSSSDEVSRARLVGEWTAQRARDALAQVDGLDPQLVDAPAAAPVASWVEIALPRGGTARVASRAMMEAQPGFVVLLYGDDTTGTSGRYATSLVAADEERLRELVTVLHGA